MFSSLQFFKGHNDLSWILWFRLFLLCNNCTEIIKWLVNKSNQKVLFTGLPKIENYLVDPIWTCSVTEHLNIYACNITRCTCYVVKINTSTFKSHYCIILLHIVRIFVNEILILTRTLSFRWPMPDFDSTQSKNSSE